MKKLHIFAILIALFAIGASDSFAQKKKTTRKKPTLTKKAPAPKVVVAAKPAIKLFTVEQGQVIRVRMENTISSKTSKAGDTFSVKTTEPIYANTGQVVMPAGSTIMGRIDAVKPAAKGGKPGTIEVSFYEVRVPNGMRKAVNGSLTELDSKSAKSDTEGTASGDKMKYRKPIFIGGGATGGAIIGGAIGGGLGAAIGAGVGALGGFITETQTKGENATVKSGTEFGIILNQSVALPKFVEADEN